MRRLGLWLLLGAIGCGDSGSGTGIDSADLPDLSGNGGLDFSTDDLGPTADLTVGPPNTTIPSTEISLGSAPCGGTAPADQSLLFTNSGGMPLTYTATIPPGGVFSLAGADSTGTVAGTVQPGDAASLTIHGSPVPGSATAGMKQTGVLTLLTNVPNSAPIQIPLSQVASGGSLTLAPAVNGSNPANANFGMTPFNQSATPIPLMLTNAGNAPVMITITQPNDLQFGLTGSSGTLTLGAGMSVASLAASFTPTSYTQSNASSIIAVASGVICGASANLITFQGQGSGASVMSTPGSGTTIDFGSANCGTSGLTGRLVTLSNGGNVDYNYDVTLGQGASSPFSLSKSMGTVPKINGSTIGNDSFTVTPKNVSQLTTPGTLSDVLTVSPQSGQTGPTLTLNLTLTVKGALLAWQTVPVPYQNVSAGGSQSQPVTVINMGNLQASPTLSVSNQSNSKNPFSVTTPLSVPIGGMLSGSGAVAFSPPQGDFATETAQLNLAAGTGDVICGALPQPVSLSGTGLAGGFGVMPSSLSFGNNGMVPCQTTAAPQTFTLTNNGNADYTWTASLGRTPSPFMLSATSGTVTKGGQQVITVTPLALPQPASTAANAYGDVVTITTNIDSTLHTVALNQTAQGAVLSFSAASIDFGGVPLGQTSTQQFNVVNGGNAPANVTLTAARQSGPTDATYLVSSAAMVTLTGLTGSQQLTASFAPGGAAADASASTATLHMTVDNATVLCAALPGDLPETGSGQNGQVLVQPPSQLTFTGPGANGLPQPPPGDTYCGTQASSQQITVSNTGSANFDVTAIAFGLTPSPYSYSLPGGASLPVTVQPNMSVVITVSSTAAPSTFVFPGNLNDSITITTNAVGDTPTTINLVQSPYGAVLTNWLPAPSGGTSTVAFGAVAAGGTRSLNLGVTNSGNAPATIVFNDIQSQPPTSTGRSPFSFTQNALVPGNNGSIPSGGQAFAATFAPPSGSAGTAYNGTATVATVATPLCGPLPATGMAMSGSSVNAPLWGAGPNPVTFDTVCGAADGAQKKTITIVNSSQDANTIQSWTAAVSNVSPAQFSFQLSKSSGGPIAPGGSDTFDLSSVAVPIDPNIFLTYKSITATITITVTGSPGTITPTSQTIDVTQNLYGLALSFKPAALKFGLLGGTPTVTVQNAGNLGVASPNLELKMTYTKGSPNYGMGLTNTGPGKQDVKTGIAAGGSFLLYLFDNLSGTGTSASIDAVNNNGVFGEVSSCWPIPSPAVSVTK